MTAFPARKSDETRVLSSLPGPHGLGFGGDLWEIESTHCPLCQSDNSHTIYREGDWRMDSCHECTMVYLNPRPTARSLSTNYRQYFDPDPKAREAYGRVVAPVFEVAAEQICRLVPDTGSVFDIGAGTGSFLQLMQNRGWTVDGCDPSDACLADPRGLVRHGALDEVECPDGQFDVVTSFFVIEHVLNPVDLVRRAHRMLKPGGLIYLFWPHTSPIVRWAHTFGLGTNLYHAPWHLQDFSPATMSRMLGENGFEEIHTSVAGSTRPAEEKSAWTNRIGFQLARWAETLSQGRWTLPGMSKATLARRSASID